MAQVQLSNVSKSYGSSQVLHGIDLHIADGELVVLVGPSGCGKSTLLRMICGLEDITAGEVRIDNQVVNDLPPAQRGIAMVFQSYALYPHMTVRGNMTFGLRIHGTGKADRDTRVLAAAKALHIDHLLDRRPRELSGGQRQRVAIGRAIVREPRLFLFDEPLSNLDAALRVQTRLEIAKLHRQLDATIVYVTHDQVEAMTLGDKIVVMHEGHIQQAGTPLDLYQQPRNLFVAGFIGSPKINLLAGTVSSADANGVLVTLAGGETVRAAIDGSALRVGMQVTLGLRSEHIYESRVGSEVFKGEVSVVEHLGEANYIYVSREGAEDVVIRGDGERHVEIGQSIVFSADSTAFHVFDEGGQALRRLRPGNMVSAARSMMRSV